MDDTVKIRVEIDIRSEGTHDTSMTVEQWNNLTGAERSAIATKCWNTEAKHNNGGIWVDTEGATEL